MMNKKGQIGIWEVALILILIGAITKVGYDIYKENKNPHPDYKDNGDGDAPITVINGDDGSSIFAKEIVLRDCQIYKNQWLLDPVMLIQNKDTSEISCVTCTEFASMGTNIEIISKWFYKSIERCDCGGASCEGDANLFEGATNIEKEINEKNNIKQQCPPIFAIGSTTIIKDYLCEWKLALADYFKYLIIGIAILVGVISWLLSYAMLRKHFTKKKDKVIRGLIPFIIGILLGTLVYFYFWIGILVVILYWIISAIFGFKK